jgi:hypothetical protein
VQRDFPGFQLDIRRRAKSPGAFDGDTGSLIRTPAINPLVLTLSFSETQCVDGFRIWFLGGDNQWEVEGAATLTDLDGQNTNTSYRLLVPSRTDQESQWNIAGADAPQAIRVLRLTLRRLTGDGYAHLCEWEIDHRISLQLLSTGIATARQVHWSTEPSSPYMLQRSFELSNWVDHEYALSRTSSLSQAYCKPVDSALLGRRLGIAPVS